MLNKRSFSVLLVLIGLAVFAVYWRTWKVWSSSLETCCEEPVKECWACRRGVNIDEFCADNPGSFECPHSKGAKCCDEQNKSCLACKEGIPVKDFCAKNPGKFECSSTETNCCAEQKKDCLACSARVSVEEFCAKYPGEYGCQKITPACCQEQQKECLACQKHQTVDDFCEENAGSFGCLKKCCTAKTKECLACQGGMTTDEFCSKNPKLYDCLKESRGDIMLGISLFNKKGYTQFTASVMHRHLNISEKDIHLFDDASTEYNETDLREWYGKDVQFFASKENLGVGTRVRRIVDYFVSSDYKVLFLIDGETIFLEHWENFIKSHIYNASDGFLSLYHSSVNHSFPADCEKPVGDLCDGGEIRTMAVALTHSFAETLSKKYPGPFKDLNWTKILRAENVRSLYPTKSLAMRIGQTNQGDDYCGENEVAYRFNRCALPDWIKNGIEFYFDRCTSPSELFSLEHSMEDIEKEGRFWTRPVVSYSLYGSRPRYTQIARENSARVFSIYPGWKIWIYTDGSVPAAIMKEICEFDVRFIDMSKSKVKSKMSWRFFVASAPVKMYAVRDVDSYLLKRGKAAVDEWIKSGRKFHVLRDHPNHSRYPMSGGMWGGTHDAIPNMTELMESRQMNNNYMQDMNFLNGFVWKIAIKSVWAHDSHSIHKFGEDHPFPTKLEAPDKFIGKVVLYPEPK